MFKPRDRLARMVEAFRAGGGEGKPMYLQAQVCWAADEAEARRQAHDQWRTTIFDSPVLSTLEMPEQFDQAAAFVGPEELEGHIRISADPKRHAAWIEEYIALGFAAIYLHNVGRDQERFIAAFGEHVLPALPKGGD